ncbi:MAG TPA: AAA domain-containing protein [Trebonia sp.]|jgi:very-short-patch-repair endonuclease|nr:AAA domain-containing protein [Trebonia sp.]
MNRRADLVRQTVGEWTKTLVDLTGRNSLLNYRDLKLGTLDLTSARDDVIASLLSGKAVRASALLDEAEQRPQAMGRLRAIHNKAKENSEERGLETASLGCGLATWENKKATAWQPSAPVLLMSISLRPIGAAHDDFEISATGELEVNPTLLQVLRADFGCEIDRATLLAHGPDHVADEPWDPESAFQWLSGQASAVPGFRVDRRIVVANFAYAKLEMVRDLEASLAELAGHDLIAALAGDAEARAAIRAQGPGPDAVPGLDQTPLSDEFLILDADSSQNYAINAVLGGQNLIVKGPPGTGKSQTIANLMASLAARGKTVLFVAEKRAAIEAVTKRLGQQGLSDLVLDLHGGVTSRQAFARSIGQALGTLAQTPRVGNEQELARVEQHRDELNAYVRALHEPRQWGQSVYEMRAELLGLDGAGTAFRLSGRSVAALDGAAARAAEADLARYVELGGLSLAASDSAWAHSPITTADQARQAADTLGEVLGSTLPQTGRLLDQGCRATGIPFPATIAQAAPAAELWTRIAALGAQFSPALYTLDLTAEQAALAPTARGGFGRLWASVTSPAYRAARARVRATALASPGIPDRSLASGVAAGLDVLGRWAGLGGEGTPRAPQNAAEVTASCQQLRTQLAEVEERAGRAGLAELPLAGCREALGQLDAERATLGRLPELHRLRSRLESAGLAGLLADLAVRQSPAGEAVRAFRHAFLRSVLDHLALTDPLLGRFSGETHQRVVAEFGAGDRRHLAATPGRVRRAHAERAVQALNAYPDEAALVRRQAALKRKHLPVRTFVRDAANVLLALKPCWAMSPLVVSQLLPAAPCFDVVIFDEASQITPSDAATSLLRGRQLVVAGDDKQLPPTAFFASASRDDDADPGDEAGEEALPLLAGTAGFESILAALDSLLGFRTLTWHYRSRDERLIAFSNQHVYDGMLTTFPGTGGDRVLRFVPASPSALGDTNSPAPEVNAVVDLILEHAGEHPDESLGVITMGIAHRNRVEEALRQRLRDDAALAAELGEFFDEGREEKFFVKNIERVQGDERDAIILSVGYGKDAAGRLPYRFGPLLTEGGERRLNVAVTRAKGRLTLVSSFSAHDMDPGRSSATGVRLLRQYLEYVESGGTSLGSQVADRPPLNPFEADVRDALAARGLGLTPQYGVSGYWIDFAVRHPAQPGRCVLAIECDGATYHSSPSARDRDRLRQEQLERLGWRFHRIWSTDWFTRKQACVDAAVAAYERALAEDDGGRAVPGPANPAPAGPAPAQPWPGQPAATPGSDPVPAPGGQAAARSTRNPALNPGLVPGYPIGDYTSPELRQLAAWIRSDDVLRTDDELLAVMMHELDFQRQGARIVAALSQAIAETRG